MFRRPSGIPVRIGRLLRQRFCTPDEVLEPATPCLLYVLHFKSVCTTTNTNFESPPVSSQDYLLSSLSLSSESKECLKIIRRKPVTIRSKPNADSVIALFSNFGFNHAHMMRMLSVSPHLLTYDSQKVLKPKLDFLAQSGISRNTLVHVLISGPPILARSLQNHIVPCINFLYTFFNNDHKTLNTFLSHKRSSFFIRCFSETATPANVDTLRRHGVPDSSIVKLALMTPSVLSHDAQPFSDTVRDIMEMGFDPLSNMFVHGVRILAGMSREKWVAKLELMKKSFGWNDAQQVVALFMKQDTFMGLSEEKLRRGFSIFIDRLGWTPDYVAKYPAVLGCNFDKRILPRIAVLEILASKGFLKKAVTGRAFMISEDEFLRLFVNKYQQHLPQVQLLEIYTNTIECGKLKN